MSHSLFNILLIELFVLELNQMIENSTHCLEPFASAFIITSCSPQLNIYGHQFEYHHDFVSDLLITDGSIQIPNKPNKIISLGQSFQLYIYKNSQKFALSQIIKEADAQQQFEKVPSYCSQNNIFRENLFMSRSSSEYMKNRIVDISLDQNNQSQSLQFQNDNYSSQAQSFVIQSHLKLNGILLKIKIKCSSQKDQDQLFIKLKAQSKAIFEKQAGKIQLENFPVFCFPSGIKLYKKQGGCKTFNFTLIDSDAQRVYCSTLRFCQKIPEQILQKLEQKYKIKHKQAIFAEKSFTLVSKHNCTDQTTQCLYKLFFHYLTKGNTRFVSHIKNFKQNFTINEKSKKVVFRINDCQVGFKVNSSYPQTSVNAIYAAFKFLEIQNIVEIFQGLMMEQKIFFISECSNILGFIIQAFQSFLFPCFWVHHIVPMLNNSLLDYIQAPMPIIYGLNNDMAQKIKESSEGIYVYLDRNQVKNKSNNKKQLFYNLRALLINKLTEFRVYDRRDVKDYLQNTQNLSLFKTKQEQDPKFDAFKIRNIFFELLVFILKDYKEYFKAPLPKQSPSEPLPIKKIYQFEALKKRHKKDPFLYSFFDTDLFGQLIQAKYNEPKNKWLRTLDKAIKKIKKQYPRSIIKQESDTQSDYNQTDGENQFPDQIPKGCLNIIHIFSKESEQDRTSSSPSPRKSFSPRFSEKKSQEVTKPSNQNIQQFDNERKNSISTNGKNSISDCGEFNEIQNNKRIVYLDDEGQDIDDHNGVCFYISYPYRRAKQTSAVKWTKKQFLKIKNWIGRDKHQETRDISKSKYQEQLEQKKQPKNLFKGPTDEK